MSAVPNQPAPLRRDREGGVLGGVCSGLGLRLGVDPLVLRVVFIAASAAGGVGLVAYLLAWALIPAEGPARWSAPRVPGSRESWQVASGIGLIVLSVLLLFREWGLWIGDALVWPVVLAVAGGALLWRESTSAPRAPAHGTRALRVGGNALGRAALGAALVVGAGLIFLYLNDALRPARDVLLAVVVVVVALTLILAPWWIRLARGLAEERAERIRSQERAELAAHLHDSVLQTLALMQRRSQDPRTVASLARRQERELRAWLNGAGAPGERHTLASALHAAASEIEEAHGVPIDVVAVGDCPLDTPAEAVVGAAREALVNAAKFAGEGPVSVYAEAGEDRVQVFVRDRGPGFDPAGVPGDRRGLRESIIGRMQRHGGEAVVHTGAGAGTEVELTLERRS
ncbi:MAG TPA: PspC domain-containing protein [Solirubrobacteraceae bacterium]|nr:PspC domain-containing protein [Solirubrobacteraceae bacterium]